MSRYRFAEIHCDGKRFNLKTPYKQHEDYFQPGHCSMKNAIAQARKVGWVRKRIDGVYRDFCPACAKEL